MKRREQNKATDNVSIEALSEEVGENVADILPLGEAIKEYVYSGLS